jgi:dCTP deaminase
MIIPAQTLRKIKPVEPFCERTQHNGMTFGLGPAGYDVRIAETATVGRFVLASTIDCPTRGSIKTRSAGHRELGNCPAT